MKFVFHSPTKVNFGSIDYSALCNEINSYGNKILILSGGESTTSIAFQVQNSIQSFQKDYQITLINGIQSNPLGSKIEEIKANTIKPEVIISVGGGSIHDSAKALSILFTHQGNVEQFTVDGIIGVTGITHNTIPIITIPTIFGSGAEISPAALIRICDKKRIIYSPNIFPKSTFVNPKFALSANRQCILYSALDAFVQGIESYVSAFSQDYSVNFSLSAIRRIVSCLIKYKSNLNNSNALEQIALSANESMNAIMQSSVGAIHALSDPLSGLFNLHHGAAVGFLLPAVINANYPFATEKYNNLQRIIDSKLGVSHDSLRDSIIAFYEQIDFDYESIGQKLKDCGIEKKIDQCVIDSFNNDLEGNPRLLDNQTIKEIFYSALR